MFARNFSSAVDVQIRPVTAEGRISVRRRGFRAALVALTVGAVSLSLAGPAAAETPAQAMQKLRQAEAELQQADADLGAHLQKEPKDVQSTLGKQRDDISPKIFALDTAIKAAQKNLEIAKFEQGEVATKVAKANDNVTNLRTQATEAATKLQQANDLWASPAAGLVRDYDTWFKKVTRLLPSEDLADARKKIRENNFADSPDVDLRKLGNDLKYHLGAGSSSDIINRLKREIAAIVNPVLANLDEAEKVKKDLLDNHGLYPWSAEADAARKADKDVPALKTQKADLEAKATKAAEEANKMAADYGKLSADVVKATAKVKEAEDKKAADTVTLKKLEKDLQKKIDENSKAMSEWGMQKIAIEKRQADAREKIARAKDNVTLAIGEANNVIGSFKKRWNVFKVKVTARLADVKQRIATAQSDDEKLRIRQAEIEEFTKGVNSVATFINELQSSAFNDGTDETKGIRDLIADARVVGGQIDAIIAALNALVEEKAVNLTGQWQCGCNATWTITMAGANTAGGAAYSVNINLPTQNWSCNFPRGRFIVRTKSDGSKEGVLTARGKDSEGDDFSLVLVYDYRSGRMAGPLKNLNPDHPRTDGEEVWRVE